jgi:hypothetical protein
MKNGRTDPVAILGRYYYRSDFSFSCETLCLACSSSHALSDFY